MDDVLLDTLARTLAEHAFPGAAWDGLHAAVRAACRRTIEFLLAVTGEDGEPLLQIRGRDGV